MRRYPSDWRSNRAACNGLSTSTPCTERMRSPTKSLPYAALSGMPVMRLMIAAAGFPFSCGSHR